MNEPKWLEDVARYLECQTDCDTGVPYYNGFVSRGAAINLLAHIRELRAALATALSHPGVERFDLDTGMNAPCDCDECKAAQGVLARQGPPEVKP
jgi:hypothetical protein